MIAGQLAHHGIFRQPLVFGGGAPHGLAMIRRALFVLFCAVHALAAGPVLADRVLVFAAASLAGALDQVAADYSASTGHEVVISYAGSSALARQIQQVAPADIFISANSDWMDALDEAGMVQPGSRVDLLSNELVLIGRSETGLMGENDPAKAIIGHRIAMALVDAVPAGIYGKSSLEALGLWDEVADNVVQVDNVRAALAMVAIGAAPFGIVYATDAQAEPRVTVLARLPDATHPPIRYPMARIAGQGGAAADGFAAYLTSSPARAAFTAAGFHPLPVAP